MKNQSGAIKTNLELYRVVMGGSGGYRRLTGGSDDFSLQTNTQTLHHNIYIIIVAIITITVIILTIMETVTDNKTRSTGTGYHEIQYQRVASISPLKMSIEDDLYQFPRELFVN